MYELNSILENKLINALIAGFKRSPNQLNEPHKSDSEIIKINDNTVLALTTDSISEEISTGLYGDPYLIGWMVVTVNMSDLAAVGSSPMGILISEIIPKNFPEEKILELQRGVSEACNFYNTFILGGDTNEGDNLVLTGTAIGIVKKEKPLSRIGCEPSEILYSSGKLGSGNAYAISKIISRNDVFSNYKPVAQTKYIDVINKYASSCMDTSDGLVSTLDQLMRLNDVGFKVSADLKSLIDSNAFSYVRNLNIPDWLLLAGQHGEFELIFTIPEELNKSFLLEVAGKNLEPIELGKVISKNEIIINVYDKLIPINTTLVRNLPVELNGDVNHYLEMLLEYNNQLRNESHLNFTSYLQFADNYTSLSI